MNTKESRSKPRNLIAKDLRTPKYKMRVVQSDRIYSRKKQKQTTQKELAYV